MATIALLISYNGAPFHGFARQEGDLLTVQGSLEEALSLLYRREVETVCAGRTDTGVHARGQVVTFEVTPEELASHTPHSLIRSLNALTHDAIGIRQLRRAPDGFSARFDAKSRHYRYFISDGSVPPLVMRDFCWQVRGGVSLDANAMTAAAAYLVGEHDFKSFCLAVSAAGKPTRREVLSLTVERIEVLGDEVVCIDIIGSSFLHSMVRTIAGTLVAVGRGLRPPSWMAEVLAACDRTAAGEKAPAAGLVFWDVDYGNVLPSDGFWREGSSTW
ncbi:pseudouridylate synthase I [Cryptobacterium curtum DSM 15641]|uniref:tRNA pseudouridine synthase A n=1 Tax=Cryptobacterium curtum (strain ATCC 700683 / DSM 15641 / CCUG 43107 / 12-3) TaxID=469378 RepID=C7MKU0_CRYCD|nr:tRNA pseudouridine(38-40) synthase TruA [Cryptobacterium curtum]ACU94887.1 pseudouridylate synthase I [Cryptobacterium curtum DSM 15641]